MSKGKGKGKERVTPEQVQISQFTKFLTDFEENERSAIIEEVKLFPHILELNVELLSKAFKLLDNVKASDDIPTPQEFKTEIKTLATKRITEKKKGKVGKIARKEYLSPEQDLLKQQNDIFRYVNYIIATREMIKRKAKPSKEGAQEEKEEEISESEEAEEVVSEPEEEPED